MTNIRNTWTYKNIQLIIILGLVSGIALNIYGLDLMIEKVFANEVEYTKTEVAEKLECVDGEGDCIIEVLLKHYTEKNFEENRAYYMELARMDAVEDVNEALLGRLDDSPHFDYEAAEEKFGY